MAAAGRAGLKVFFDSFSQPSRAVLLLLQANNVKYEPRMIKIAQGEQRTNEEFLKVCASKKLPAIDDNGFHLFESSAILRYLVTQYRLPQHWYPSEPHQRARVDEYLSWHGTTLRIGAAELFFSKVFMQKLLGKEPDPERVELLEGLLKHSKKMMENYFLKDSKFISGDKISIADLQAVCELSQYWLVGADPTEGYPRVALWMKNVQSMLQPHFDEVHKMVYIVRDRGIFKAKL